MMPTVYNTMQRCSFQVCQEAKQKWVEDPTNVNPIFTRSRVRDAIQKMEGGVDWRSCNFSAVIVESYSPIHLSRSSGPVFQISRPRWQP